MKTFQEYVEIEIRYDQGIDLDWLILKLYELRQKAHAQGCTNLRFAATTMAPADVDGFGVFSVKG